MPIALAFLSWAYFPAGAQWVTKNVFGYNPLQQVANPVWLLFIGFFYVWYTFLAIAIAGVWIVAAFLARRKRVVGRQEFYPMVSFVVPAFNEEANIARCVKSLYGCAEAYGGNCEILVVDDGSMDFTYEAAWQAVAECKAELHVQSSVEGYAAYG